MEYNQCRSEYLGRLIIQELKATKLSFHYTDFSLLFFKEMCNFWLTSLSIEGGISYRDSMRLLRQPLSLLKRGLR